MAAPAIGVRPRVVPGVSAPIDWSHPLAQGLFCWRAGHGPMQAANPTVSTLSRTSAGAGPGLQGTATSTSETVNGFQTGPWTYFAYVTPTSLASAIILATMAESPGSGTQDRLIGIRGTGATYRGAFFPGSLITIDGTTAAVVGRSDTVVLTGGGSAFSLWVNGAREATNPSTNSGFNGYASPELSIGRGDGTGLDLGGANAAMNAVVHAFGCWRRELSAAEIEALHADPFCLLRR